MRGLDGSIEKDGIWSRFQQTMDPRHIRNFAIIAHIDHGKSTLSDRLLELTGSLSQREMQAQVLDAMDLERERGITIKAHTVRMMYKAEDGELYQLNLIDTPGHVDFSYEVSRSLASCEGALLVVDASQGVEAQTLANAYLAIAGGLEIIPDHQQDRPAERGHCAHQGDDREVSRAAGGRCCGGERKDRAECRADSGSRGDAAAAAQGRSGSTAAGADLRLSWFDAYRGVIVLARIINGRLRKGMKIKIMSNGKQFDVDSAWV